MLDVDGNPLKGFNRVTQGNGETFVTGQAERLVRFTVLEGQWKHTHADKIGAMDALKGGRNDSLRTEQVGSFRSPVSRRTRTVLATGKHDLGRFDLSGVVHRHNLARFVIKGVATFGPRRHLVANANVGKGTSHHDFVVASATAEGIEIASLDVALNQPLTRWPAGGEGTCRRNVVGGDGITELEKHLCAFDRLDGVGC